MSGPGGRMLGRDLQWVLGADYRREAGSLAEDPLHAEDYLAGFGNTGPVCGEPTVLTTG